MKGIVKSLVRERNYGFIRAENGGEYFFHREDFSGFWDDLIGDYGRNDKVRVTFEVTTSPKGPRASNVKRVDFPNNSQAVHE